MQKQKLPSNAKETDFYLSSITKKTGKINHRFSCNFKCLIYLLTCQKYEK